MAIEPGQQLLHYRLIDKIGEGGMGVVWKAQDTNLDREVAIKFLPDVSSADPERMARFEREAKTLAALQHPGIAGIFGLHQAEGKRFIAMELVVGEDLSQRTSRGPMSEEDALDVTRQIAEALEAAHEIGVIHRDLKPANIRLTPDGKVKVLDFGLAKALDPTVSGSGTDTLGLSPTMTSAGTVAGTILGTAGYMSPEQAKGRAVDRRADIWALGCVLFEMLTGRQLFQAETISETLAAVLLTEPDLDALPDNTSAQTRWLLQRCLTRDPRERLRDVGEARVATQKDSGWIPPAAAGDTDEIGVEALTRSRWLWPGAAALLGLVAFVIGFATSPSEEAAPQPLRKFEISRDAVNRAFDNPPVLSPDGQRIAYVHDESVWIRDFARLEPRKLIEGGDTPFWSQDGRRLAFERDKKLWRIDVGGGEPALICDLPVRGALVSGVWDANDMIWVALWRGGIYRVPARGGNPEEVVPIAEDEVDFHDLTLLPDGNGLLFVNHMMDPESGVWIESNRVEAFKGGNRQPVDVGLEISRIDSPFYSRGHLLYERGDASQGIWAVPFSPETLETTGEPFMVVASAAAPSVSEDGTLAYLPVIDVGLGELQFTMVDRNGKELKVIGGSRPQHHFSSLSPDGTRLAVAVGADEDELDIWIHEIESGGSYQLTHAAGSELFPFWSADSRSLYYQVEPAGCNEFRCVETQVRPANGSGQPENLGSALFAAPVADGAEIVFGGMTRSGVGVFRKTVGGDGKPIAVVNDAGFQFYPRVSPDGRYVAYTSFPPDGESSDVYLAPYPSGTRRWKVSVEGGKWPAWNAAGDRLYFVQGFDVMEAEISYKPALKIERAAKLFSMQQRLYSGMGPLGGTPLVTVSGDGERFVVPMSLGDLAPASRGIVVVQNWVSEFVD